MKETFTAEFGGAWEERGLFLLTMHPRITGHRSRMPVWERLIKHMKAEGSCWSATQPQVAGWCKEYGETVLAIVRTCRNPDTQPN